MERRLWAEAVEEVEAEPRACNSVECQSPIQDHGFPDVYISKFWIWQRPKIGIKKKIYNPTLFLGTHKACCKPQLMDRSSLRPSRRFAAEYRRMALLCLIFRVDFGTSPDLLRPDAIIAYYARNSSISSNCWIAMQSLPQNRGNRDASLGWLCIARLLRDLERSNCKFLFDRVCRNKGALYV